MTPGAEEAVTSIVAAFANGVALALAFTVLILVTRQRGR